MLASRLTRLNSSRVCLRQTSAHGMPRLPSSRLGRRGITDITSEHSTKKSSSDLPWIIGSALVFGPALIYLLSPSARKNIHAPHNDKHDFPGHKKPESIPQIMKDDEGTPADVTQSIELAESVDSPKDAQNAEEQGVLMDTATAVQAKQAALDHFSELNNTNALPNRAAETAKLENAITPESDLLSSPLETSEQKQVEETPQAAAAAKGEPEA